MDDRIAQTEPTKSTNSDKLLQRIETLHGVLEGINKGYREKFQDLQLPHPETPSTQGTEHNSLPPYFCRANNLIDAVFEQVNSLVTQMDITEV